MVDEPVLIDGSLIVKQLENSVPARTIIRQKLTVSSTGFHPSVIGFRLPNVQRSLRAVTALFQKVAEETERVKFHTDH
jgi:hypothetical protein